MFGLVLVPVFGLCLVCGWPVNGLWGGLFGAYVGAVFGLQCTRRRLVRDRVPVKYLPASPLRAFTRLIAQVWALTLMVNIGRNCTWRMALPGGHH